MNLEKAERPDAISEKFKNPEKLEIEGGTVEIVCLEPPPERLKTPVWLVVEPGWLGNVETWEQNARALVNEGRRVMIIAAPHGVEPGREDSEVPMAELRKAVAFTRILDAKNMKEKVDVLTHSEGGVFMTAAILENPERVRALIYDAPVGLIGSDNFWKLSYRFVSDVVKEELEARKGKGGEERAAQRRIGQLAGGKALLTWPGSETGALAKGKAALQGLKEVIAMAGVQTQDNIRELRAQGVKVYIMHPAGDLVSPISYQTGTPAREVDGTVIFDGDRVRMRTPAVVKADMVDGYMSVGDPSQTGEISDTHNAVFLSPRQYSRAIDGLLDTAERNIKKEEAVKQSQA